MKRRGQCRGLQSRFFQANHRPAGLRASGPTRPELTPVTAVRKVQCLPHERQSCTCTSMTLAMQWEALAVASGELHSLTRRSQMFSGCCGTTKYVARPALCCFKSMLLCQQRTRCMLVQGLISNPLSHRLQFARGGGCCGRRLSYCTLLGWQRIENHEQSCANRSFRVVAIRYQAERDPQWNSAKQLGRKTARGAVAYGLS